MVQQFIFLLHAIDTKWCVYFDWRTKWLFFCCSSPPSPSPLPSSSAVICFSLHFIHIDFPSKYSMYWKWIAVYCCWHFLVTHCLTLDELKRKEEKNKSLLLPLCWYVLLLLLLRFSSIENMQSMNFISFVCIQILNLNHSNICYHNTMPISDSDYCDSFILFIFLFVSCWMHVSVCNCLLEIFIHRSSVLMKHIFLMRLNWITVTFVRKRRKKGKIIMK